MSISGRSGSIISSIVSPSINVPGRELLQGEGTLRRELRFQDHPSASLEYRGLSRSQVQGLISAFDFCQRIRIYGIQFELESKSSSRERYTTVYEPEIDVYTFSVNLQGILKRKVEKQLDIRSLVRFPPLPPVPPGTTVPNTEPQPRSATLDVSAIARAADVSYQGPTFSITVAEDYAEKRSLDDILREQAPRLGGFVRYSKDRAEIVRINGLRRWSFPIDVIHQDGSNSEQRPIRWKDVQVTGLFSQVTPPENPEEDPNNPEGVTAGGGGGQEQPQQPQPPRIVPIPPVQEEVVEEDENPEQPPANSFVLRTLDSNFDMSGPRKTRRKTITVDGTPDRTITEVWGFAYRKKDIAILDSAGEPIGIFSDAPAQWWRKIEHTEEQYVYKEISLVRYSSEIRVPVAEAENVFYTGPTEADGTRYLEIATCKIEPGYEGMATVTTSGRNQVNVAPVGKYLTEINTTGWKLTRYMKEGDRGDTLDPENPYNIAGCYDFFQNPQNAKTLYKLRPTRAIYGDQVGLPFSVRIESNFLVNPANANHPDPLQRYLFREQDTNGRVYYTRRQTNTAVITPSLDYVEPLTIMVESRQVASFKVRADPSVTPDEQDPNKGPLITGEESYFRVERTILRPPTEEETNSDGTRTPARELKYLEREVNYTAQEAGFVISAEQVRFREVIGRPPEAQTRKTMYQVIPADQDPRRREYTEQRAEQTYSIGREQNRPGSAQSARYFVSSPQVGRCDLVETESRDYPTARTPQEALAAAKVELAIANMSTINCSKTLSFFYPQIMDGDIVDCDGDLIDGDKIVSSVSFSLTFQGRSTRQVLPTDCATCDGTQLQLGLWEIPQLQLRTENRDVAGQGEGNTATEENIAEPGELAAPQIPGNPETIVDLTNETEFEMGGVLVNEAHRRKFSLS